MIASIVGGMPVVKLLPCDVTKDEEIAALTGSLGELGRPIDALVHSLAFASRDDLSRPFVETQREGFLLAQNVSAYSFVAMARAVAPLMTSTARLHRDSEPIWDRCACAPIYNVMGVAKAALEASVRYLASDLGPSRIRVNAISWPAP